MGTPGRVSAAALALVPGALVVVMSFNGGGFFVTAPALAAVGLALILILRTTLAERPFEGLGRLAAVAAGALALLAAWTLLSATWSDATARALLEFDRVLLYLLTVVLIASVPRSAPGLRLILGGVAAGIVAVCVIALITRLAPDVWPVDPNIEDNRLNYPLTYWNALGLLAAMGMVLCLHHAASEREPWPIRVLAAAALPAVGTTLLLTFSRGAIAVCVVGVVSYCVLARPRGLAGALLAAGPVSAIAMIAAYRADLLATPGYAEAAGVAQGHDVALTVAICCLAAAALRGLGLVLDAKLTELVPRGRLPRRAVAGGVVAFVVVAIGLGVAAGAPGYVERQYDRFITGNELEADSGDTRRRLTDPANNGRLDLWRAALEPYHDRPVSGRGAGTFALTWARERPFAFEIVDGHSLYVEVLGELGIVGLALVAVAIVALLAGAAGGIRGPDRHLHAAAFAVVLAWAVRAGIDWDWEMPAVTLPALALGAAAAAAPAGRESLGARMGSLPRVGIGLAWLVLALTPALAALSQHHLDRAITAFKAGDCVESIDAALDAADVLGQRPEPWELIGYCDVRLGQERLGVRALENAVERDPDSWEAHYGLALVRAAAGVDPRVAARTALRLNPRDELTTLAARYFDTDDRAAWRRRALKRTLRVPP